MDSNFEKIHLQKADVKYLYHQVHKAAMDKLNLYLPSESQQADNNNEEDPVREKVRLLVEEFILNSFELTKYSCIIDGKEFLDDDDPLRQILVNNSSNRKNKNQERREEIESFDFELNQKLREAYKAVEDETVKVTEKRRNLPQKSVKLFEEQQNINKSKIDTSLSKLEEIEKQIDQDYQNEDNGIYIDDEVKTDYEDMMAEFNDTLKRLQEVKQHVPQRKQELEKLQVLMNFVESNYDFK
ncbi:MIND complex subunit NSL1 ASCRUDRAFT_129312 [Ascoidea rubescens DSM 1968]|uniref:Mis14-domain-containing protein n=1 Tax=Ascoidea rubescens DSM 1968 TaxID=1344418 RepID=A0A1D2V8V4_9ASCO|nr:hypothetical protein ASCRUDRAFT_129312 [Ascoidea rubescens DSM 1968]ODV58048.1 hypothetical protein ASCRUDRAFT_129312 [Ascoidea rubescens DSM 1968]